MKSSSSMVLTALENQQGFLEVQHMSSMSHTSGTNIISGSYVSKYKESPLGDNVNGIGG
jgi:hypothetical protein